MSGAPLDPNVPDSPNAHVATSFDLGPVIEPPDKLLDRSITQERVLKTRRWRHLENLRDSVSGSWWIFAFTFAVLVAVVVLLALNEDYLWLVILLLAAVLLNLIVLAIAGAARRFAWLGVAIFLSVPLFGGFVALVRTERSPKVQPIALIRKGDNVGLCGIYVTETAKRVYIGRIEPMGKDENENAIKGTGRIFWVPDDQVDMVKIGALQSPRNANTRAPRLLEELYRDRAEDPGVLLKATSETTDDGKTKTVAEKAPHPPVQASVKPAPENVANTCTDVSLARPLPVRAKPKSSDPLRRPYDDSPRDP